MQRVYMGRSAGKTVPVHAMKAHRASRVALIFNLGTSWCSTASFTPRPPYRRENALPLSE
jgi:hypothetical protein